MEFVTVHTKDIQGYVTASTNQVDYEKAAIVKQAIIDKAYARYGSRWIKTINRSISMSPKYCARICKPFTRISVSVIMIIPL